MKHARTILTLFAMIFVLGAAANAASSIDYFDTIKSDPEVKVGETYYTRHNLMYENDKWDATNYWRGTLLPINTKVTVSSISGDSMQIAWNGGSLKIDNSKYTKCTIAELAKRMLTPNPVPIEKLGNERAANITAGQLVKGMTREQVIMTRGYPPAHKTPSITTENAKWTYWSSRYATEGIVIKDGKLEEGRNVIL